MEQLAPYIPEPDFWTFNIGCCNVIRSRPGKPNQRKADWQAGSRIWGVFVNSECFFLEKTRRIHKTPPKFANCTDFCEFSLLYTGKTL